MVKLGAKCKLNTDLQDEICSYLRNGMVRKSAVARAGIAESTFYEWMKKGKKAKKGKFRDFYDAILIAEGEASANFESIVIEAVAGGDVESAKWWLRRRVKEYQDTNKIDAKVELSGLSRIAEAFKDYEE